MFRLFGPFRRNRVERKSVEQLRAMRAAGLVVGRTLQHLRETVVPGMTTGQIDAIARETIEKQGARPSFPDVPGYRHTVCVSVGEEIVHGIPGDKVVREGDLVSIDCGAIVAGWHGDAAVSIFAGGEQAARPDEVQLVADTAGSLEAGIAAMRPGRRVGDIGAAVERYLIEAGGRAGVEYGIVDEYEGHGIGREMHMHPGVPNYATKKRGPKLTVGVTLAIEPMVTLGSAQTHTLEDEWTAVTVDGSTAAHVEHTAAITPDGVWVLTAVDGGESLLARAGAPFGPLD